MEFGWLPDGLNNSLGSVHLTAPQVFVEWHAKDRSPGNKGPPFSSSVPLGLASLVFRAFSWPPKDSLRLVVNLGSAVQLHPHVPCQ